MHRLSIKDSESLTPDVRAYMSIPDPAYGQAGTRGVAQLTGGDGQQAGSDRKQLSHVAVVCLEGRVPLQLRAQQRSHMTL